MRVAGAFIVRHSVAFAVPSKAIPLGCGALLLRACLSAWEAVTGGRLENA